MNSIWRRLLAGAVVGWLGVSVSAQDTDKKPDPKIVVRPDATTEGTVNVDGQVVEYRAVAGTLTVGATDSQDAALGLDGQVLRETGEKVPDPIEARGCASHGADVLCGLLQEGRCARHAAHHVSVQRRTGFVNDVASHRIVRAEAGRDHRYPTRCRRHPTRL